MKRFIAFLCVGVISFSLTACGGSSKETVVPASVISDTTVSTTTEAPKVPERPEESKKSPDDEAKQAILDKIDVAYIGLTSAGGPMYFLASSDCEYVALVLENTDGRRYIKFVGSASIEEDSGILTVIDNEKGYTFGFTAEKQSDGSFFLDCGNFGECYLKPEDPRTVVDSIFLTFQNKVDATDDLVAAQSVLDYIEIAYSGITEAGGSMYYLASYDGSFAAIIIENAQETGYIKFIGTTDIDENGLQTVTDSEKNYTFGFIAEEQEDGSYFLDCGELGECYLVPDYTENVIEYIKITFEDMEDLTDEFMAEFGR